MNNQYVSLLVQLKNYSLLDRKDVVIKYNLKVLDLIQFLYDAGLIQSFYVTKEEIRISIRYFQGKTPLSQLKWFCRGPFPNMLTYAQMCKIPFKGRTLCISTDRGLLTIDECKRYRVGGNILLMC